MDDEIRHRGRRAVVLIVDDDKADLKLLATRLRDYCEVVTANHSHDALRQFAKRGDIDYVLTDSNLPDFSGIELCRVIRGSRLPQPAVIFVTADGANPERVDEMEEAEGNVILTKPYRREHLFRALRKAHTRGERFFPEPSHPSIVLKRVLGEISRKTSRTTRQED